MRRNNLVPAAVGVIAIAMLAGACSSGNGATGPTGSTGGSGSSTSATTAHGAGSVTPADAANGFVQGFLSPTVTPACNFVVPSQKIQCQGALAAIHISGTGITIGHTFTDGNEALVVLLAKELCVSALIQKGKSCRTNTNPDSGLPATSSAFAAAYAASFNGSKKGITTIPCMSYAGRWYVNLLAANPTGSSGASGATSSS